MRDPKNTIRLKIIIKTGKIDTDYRNLMIGNPDISGHIRTYPDINGTWINNFSHPVSAYPTAGKLIQKEPPEARRVLEHLHELGLVEGRGERGGRVYHLPASLYKRFHMKSEYVRAKGFAPLQQEQMIIDYVKEHGTKKLGL